MSEHLGMTTRDSLIATAFLLSLGAMFCSGCAKEDPLFCTANEMCLEGYQYCDLQGTCPASGFHGNTCIPEPCWDAGPIDYDAGIDADAGLDGGTPDPAMLVVSPTTEDWGAVVSGGMSGRTTFTVTNDGDSPSGPVSITLGGDHPDQFTIENLGCNGQALSGGATCDFDIRFTPTSVSPATKSATLDVSASPGGQVSANLAGVALAPGDLTMNPTEDDFGTLDVGATSASSTRFTVMNTGGAATGTLSTVLSDTANFAIDADTCNGTTLAASGSCTVDIDATPDVIGEHDAMLTVSATPGGNAMALVSVTGRVDLIVSLAGNGDGRVTSTPASIDCTKINSPCSASYTQSTQVTLTATPEPHAFFTGWSGGGCSGLADCSVTVDGATNVTATFELENLAIGSGHVCAIQPGSGALRCWGLNNFGQLGVGNTDIFGDGEAASEAGSAIASNIVQVVAGSEHTCALLADATVRCWGRATRGRLGNGNASNHIGDDQNESVGDEIDIGTDVRQLAAAKEHTCALLDNGGVRCWGSGASGRLGQGNTDDLGDSSASVPSMIANLQLPGLATQIVASGAYSCALLANGTVHCWGLGNFGVLGYGNTDSIGWSSSTALDMYGPVNVGGTVKQLAAGAVHICALLTSGDVRCWGNGASGRLGLEDSDSIGDTEAPATVAPVDVGGTVRQIACGNNHTCALLDTGEVKCWGANDTGQLGLGHTDSIGDDMNEMPPASVNVGGPVVQISAGLNTCARMATGAVRCWGDDQVGSLGYGSPEENIGDNEHPASAGDVPYIP